MNISSLLSTYQSSYATGSGSSSAASNTTTTDDANNMVASLFADLDTDNSTGLTLEEFSAVQKVMQSKMRATEAPGDGMAPPELSEDQLSEMFTAADTDDNGELSEEEFTALDEKMRAGGPPPAPPPSESDSEDSLDITAIIEKILEELAEQSDSDSDSSALAQRLQSMLQTVTYGGSGTESYGMESTSGSLLNCMC